MPKQKQYKITLLHYFTALHCASRKLLGPKPGPSRPHCFPFLISCPSSQFIHTLWLFFFALYSPAIFFPLSVCLCMCVLGLIFFDKVKITGRFLSKKKKKTEPEISRNGNSETLVVGQQIIDRLGFRSTGSLRRKAHSSHFVYTNSGSYHPSCSMVWQ